jgi:hypothetical protein
MFADLQGKKSYIVAAVLVVLVFLTKFAGIQIPGVDVGDNWLTVVMGALGLGALRSAIGTISQ